MAGQVEGVAGEAGGGEEDGGGLEGPADIVAVAMDHADHGPRGGGVGGEPGAGEEGGAAGGLVKGLAAPHPMRREEVILVRGVTPEVAAVFGVRHALPADSQVAQTQRKSKIPKS